MTRAEAIEALRAARADAERAQDPSIALAEIDRLVALFLGVPEDSQLYGDPLVVSMVEVICRSVAALCPKEPEPPKPPPTLTLLN